jgi:hypothetical protein
MSDLELILDDCLNKLAHGETTLEECLTRYPQHAVELRRLLSTASYLQVGRAIQPAPAFRARTQAQLLTHMRTHPRRRFGWLWFNWLPRPVGLAFSNALSIAITLGIIALFFFTTGTVLAQRALPGEALYGWKTTSEQLWRAVQPDPLTADLALTNRRMQEILLTPHDTQAQTLAQQGYEQALTRLSTYQTPADQQRIEQSLLDHRSTLAQADLVVIKIEELLAKIDPAVVKRPEADLQLDYQAGPIQAGQITYNLKISNFGPASPVSAQSVIDLAPQEKLVTVSDTACDTSAGGSVTCPVKQLAQEMAYNVTLTTVVDPCYAGSVVNTVAVMPDDRLINTNAQASAIATTNISAPLRHPAQIVYVQSNDQAHDLGLVSSAGNLLNASLHIRAAAPAWSPDGGKLAFFGEQGISELGAPYNQGNGLWLVEVQENQAQNPVQLVAQDHIANIAWSPDGRKLAFEVAPPDIPSEVRVVNAGSGQLVSVFPGQQPAWQIDSQQLIIKACAPGCGLWQVNLNGQAGRQLTLDGTDSYPAHSPDGQVLAFSSQRDGNWEIYTLHLSTDELTRLTHRPATDTTPIFDPCGQALYLRTDHFGDWRLTAMQLNGSAEETVRRGIGRSQDWGQARPAIR